MLVSLALCNGGVVVWLAQARSHHEFHSHKQHTGRGERYLQLRGGRKCVASPSRRTDTGLDMKYRRYMP